MKRLLLIASMLIASVMVSCGDANIKYVKKAVRIMDKNGIWLRLVQPALQTS